MTRVKAARSIDELLTQFREISQQASALFGPLDRAALTRRPKPESWSAVECLAHLNLSADPYLPLWRQEIPACPTVDPAATYRLDFWGAFWCGRSSLRPDSAFPRRRTSSP